MYETLYIYYVYPDSGFATEKEKSNNSENISGQSGFFSGIDKYFPLILIILLIVLIYKAVS